MLVKYLPSLLLHATTLTSDFSSPEGFHGKIWAVGNISICGSFENWTKSGFWSQKINVELVLKSSTSIKQCVSKDFERKIVIWSIWDLKKHSFNLIFVENHDFENEDDSHSMILFNVGVWWLNCPRPIWPSLLWIFDLRLSPWPAQTAPLSTACTRWASVQLDLLWSGSVRAFQIEFGADFLVRARHHTLVPLLKFSCYASPDPDLDQWRCPFLCHHDSSGQLLILAPHNLFLILFVPISEFKQGLFSPRVLL